MSTPVLQASPNAVGKVLVTGASGNVGRRVVPLLAGEFDLRLFALEAGEVGGMPVGAMDLTRREEVDPLLEGVDAVVHLAIQDYQRFSKQVNGKPGGEDYLPEYREGCINVNIRGTHHLYDAAWKAGVRKFVFISSMTAVLGGQGPDDEVPIRGPVVPLNFYACTKLFGEQLGQVYSGRGMQVICLRVGQPYVPECHSGDFSSRRSRSILVSSGDIAGAIRGALLAEMPFGIYPVISHSDVFADGRAAVPEIGYEPKDCFTEAGLVPG